MSGQLKEVKSRMSSVSTTMQITKAMKVVAAAKLRKAQDAINQMRPYSEKLSEILKHLMLGLEEGILEKYEAKEKVEKVLLIVITSDKGLCGAFNSNVIKETLKTRKEKYGDLPDESFELLCIGKKGRDYFKNKSYKINDDFVHIFKDLTFENAEKAALFAIDNFVDNKFHAVELMYGEFKNPAVQTFTADPFLPIQPMKEEEKPDFVPDYIFEPDKKAILQELAPKILKTKFFRALLDSNASEHGARMTAMDKATDNARDLLKELKISYNRARQAAITTELTEIVSGANALEEG